MKDLGPLHHFLGGTAIQDQSTGNIWLGQPLYTEKLLLKFGMSDCKPVRTPVNQDVKLTQCESDDDVYDQKSYQAMVGSLLYLSTRTHPDIAYAVGSVARFCTNLPRTLDRRQEDSEVLDFGLLYTRDASPDCFGHCDADWAGNAGDRKSTSGYVFLQGGSSSKQSCVALLTTEAGFVCSSSRSCVASTAHQ